MSAGKLNTCLTVKYPVWPPQHGQLMPQASLKPLYCCTVLTGALCGVCRTWESNPPPFGSTLQHTIIVPYPIQSDLSGKMPQHMPTSLVAGR